MASLITVSRVARGLSKTQLAQGCGISRQLLARLESGQSLPTPELARKLEAALGCGPLACTAERVKVKDWSLQPYDFPLVHGEFWRRAMEDWAYPIRCMALSPTLLQWMTNYLSCESLTEAYAYLQIARFKGQPQISSPHRLGLQAAPIVDALGKALGERKLPGLRGLVGSIQFWIWPQVRLKPARHPYRLDGLLLLRQAGRMRWGSLEIDGNGHNALDDDYRKRMIGLDEVRLSQRMVYNHQAAEFFQKGLLRIMNPPPVTPQA